MDSAVLGKALCSAEVGETTYDLKLMLKLINSNVEVLWTVDRSNQRVPL